MLTLKDIFLYELLLEEGKMDLSNDNYPTWVCGECAIGAGGKPRGISTMHYGKCDVCKEEKAVTQPRDYGYPVFNNS